MSQFYNESTGKLTGTPEQLLEGFFGGRMDGFEHGVRDERHNMERGFSRIEKTARYYDVDLKAHSNAGQRQDFEEYFKSQFKNSRSQEWDVNGFIRTVEQYYEQYTDLLYQKAEQIKDQRERDKRAEKEQKRAHDAAQRVRFQHEGGQPDFIPRGSVQTKSGNWQAPDGTIWRRVTTHEWSDGNQRFDDRHVKPSNPNPGLDGVYAGHTSVWPYYVLVFLIFLAIAAMIH